MIERDDKKILLIISSIVDGNIFRGFPDDKKVFECFHNMLLIYIAFEDLSFNKKDIDKELESLKNTANFYHWIIDRDRDKVTLFPSKSWFERNIMENNLVILKKGNEILFRKPTTDFHASNKAINEHYGYSEIVVNYDFNKYISLKEYLTTQKTVAQKLKKLLEIISYYENEKYFPSIYCNEKILDKDLLHPFNRELTNSSTLIYEDQYGKVETLENNQKNFITLFFRTLALDDEHGNLFKTFNEKYISNLEKNIDVLEFVKQICIQIEGIDVTEHDDFYYDISVAAALYHSLNESDSIRKIEKFVTQYDKFNKNFHEKHIYGVKREIELLEKTPIQLLETIEKCLRLIPIEAKPTLNFYLFNDIEEYKNRLQKIVNNPNYGLTIDINNFEIADIKINQIKETFDINGVKGYPFKNIKLVNVEISELQEFDPHQHTAFINLSEQKYVLIENTTIFVIAIHSSITNIYTSINHRFDYLNLTKIDKSYPILTTDKKNILSLDYFDQAVDNIKTHRDISKDEAERILIKWLQSLPPKFHQSLVTLIYAHIVMQKNEIKDFIEKVSLLLKDNATNPFLIKKIEDYNGTHRILYKDHQIGRNVDSLSPSSISENAERATIIVDCIITGKQIVDAIKFYSTGNGGGKNSKYFEHLLTIEQRLKSLKSIDICTVLYTEKSLNNIKNICKKQLNEDIEVNIIFGRDMKDDAFFETTQKIGEDDKLKIKELLKDILTLSNHLDHKPVAFTDKDINETNLVARFQSLPKKCFSFLHAELRNDKSCHPLVRIFEKTDL